MCCVVNICFDPTQRGGTTTALITPAHERNADERRKRGEEVIFYILTSGKNKESHQKFVSSLGSIKTNNLISGTERLPMSLPVFHTRRQQTGEDG